MQSGPSPHIWLSVGIAESRGLNVCSSACVSDGWQHQVHNAVGATAMSVTGGSGDFAYRVEPGRGKLPVGRDYGGAGIDASDSVPAVFAACRNSSSCGSV